MPDIRQSPPYAKYLRRLNWQVEKLKNGQVFIKKLPLLGSLIKIQRVSSLDFSEIENLAQKYRAFQIILEPAANCLPPATGNYYPLKSPYLPTKTSILDLQPAKEKIFNSFSKNKRRDIRLAEKKNLLIQEGKIEDFIQLKKKHLWHKGIFPLGVSRRLKLLVEAFGPQAKILLAYLPENSSPLAGILLLFNEHVCSYWEAAATAKGKKLLAPTLLVWEAIKLAKKKGCTTFDFEGLYDPRFPQNRSWQGFTRFKEGFRGKEVIYPLPLISTRRRAFCIHKIGKQNPASEKNHFWRFLRL